MKMIDSTLHGLIYCDRHDDFTAVTNESEFDENGNISTKFQCPRRSGEIDFKLIISHIETMSEYFPSECSKYIRKIVSFKSLPNEVVCNNIGTFLNVFIECIKYCLEHSNNFKMFCKLREGIVSVLIFVNNFKNSIRKDQVDRNCHAYKIYVLFGLLIDVELLASCYQEEEFVMTKNRLLNRIDDLLEDLDDQSLAIFYSTEFLNASLTKSYVDICVPIIEKILRRNLPILSRILLFKLWENFSKSPPFDNIMQDFCMEQICQEDVMRLQKFSPVFSGIPESCENISALLLNTKFNVPQTIQAYVKAQEETLKIDFTISEEDLMKSCANEEPKNYRCVEEKSEESVDIEPILEVVGSEHDYCSKSSLNGERSITRRPPSTSPEDQIIQESKEEPLVTDERVEIELCDLCVELGTLVIDSCVTEEIPYQYNEDEINSNTESVSEPFPYYTDPLYHLHYATCEADEKCFSQQYDYIMLCQHNVDLESSKLPEVTFLEEPRCPCQSCHNNLECLKKNLCMLTEYALKRREKIEELSENRSKVDIEFNGLVANCQRERIPPEYKRSASEILEHRLPLKKRKFSLDEA